jgi:hypothetical protein
LKWENDHELVQLGIWKEAAMACLKAFSRYSSGKIVEGKQ